MVLTIELIGHMAAGDRRLWQGDQDERPLDDLGRRQALLLAELLAPLQFDALYSSPTLRCRQTIDPIAQATRLPIQVLPGLRETEGFPRPTGWGRLPRAARSVWRGARRRCGLPSPQIILAEQAEGRAAICSHGDVVPLLIAFLGAAYGVEVPEPAQLRPLWYTLRFAGDELDVRFHPPQADFPN